MEWYDAAGISDAKKATAMGVFRRCILADIRNEVVIEQEMLSKLVDIDGGKNVGAIDKLVSRIG